MLMKLLQRVTGILFYVIVILVGVILSSIYAIAKNDIVKTIFLSLGTGVISSTLVAFFLEIRQNRKESIKYEIFKNNIIVYINNNISDLGIFNYDFEVID